MTKTFQNILLTASLLLAVPVLQSQKSSSQILQSLKKLDVTSSVLYIAAHPDDENTRLLAYLANEKKVRTAYLSLTRGDGGQNLIGKEQGEALGLIRTQELLAARRTDGAEQFFTRANDFGFSKNPEETFTFWNRDSILYDVVYTIRKFRPDVIICRFPTTGEGGHGHHTASAILALEAFDAAADANKFPDQLQNVTTWQCKRIFWNTFNFGGTNTTAENQLKVNCGVYNPLLGKGYGEVAAESRSMHKSQGFGSARQRGSAVEYFKLLKGDSAKTDLLDGVNTSWSRYAGTEGISKAIRDCIASFNAEKPEGSLPQLKNIYKQINALEEKDAGVVYWKKIKLKETASLIADCAGLFAEALSPLPSVVAGEAFSYSLQVINRSNSALQLSSVQFINGRDSAVSKNLGRDENISIRSNYKVPAGENPSEPYWLSHAHGLGHYWYPGAELAGSPENKAAFTVTFNVEFEDLRIALPRALEYKNVDPVKGELYRRVEVLPALSVQPLTKVLLFTGPEKKSFQVTIRTQAAAQKGFLQIQVPAGWTSQVKDSTFNLVKKGDEVTLDFVLQPGTNAQNGQIRFKVTNSEGQSFADKITRIEYDHIPPQFFLEPSEARLIMVPLKGNNKKLGYIPGAGDEVADCLKQAGFEVTMLTDEMLKQEHLKKFNAIVTGVRAFNTNEKLYTHLGQLMAYVQQGGNLLVQYNTNSRVGPLQAGLGPYPFTISRDRVTDEHAGITFKAKDHPVLNIPNKISEMDFEGWIQERGIYFATEIDAHYQTILLMNDKNEKPHEGSLIVAPYGKGNFVYTGLAFFRQLPAGVPGAYRLFTNILNLPPHKK